MLENFNESAELKFTELSPEEKQARGILGRLYGPIADIAKSTRNGRRYTESLWEKVFESPITQEMFAQGGVPGELDHPADREETCSEKIAIMMPAPPTKDKDGHLIGYFDIIDTPCGRIAYALAKYGFNLGISSRGTGDTFMDYESGEETVDEESYSFQGFDLVLLPACKDARLQLAESLDVKKKKFDKAIKEALETADEGAKKIMTETLEHLKFYENTTPENEGAREDDAVTESDDVADNDGTELMESLQQTLIENRKLQKQVLDLQEKLSVGYAKEMKLEGEVTKLRSAVHNLTESAKKGKALKSQVNTLTAQLNDQVRTNRQQERLIESYKGRLSNMAKDRASLNEGFTRKDEEVTTLRERVRSLSESAKSAQAKHDGEVRRLTEQVEELKRDSEVRHNQYSQKLQKSNKMVEALRKTTQRAVDKYIECRATYLGVTPTEIKNKLKEGYSFDDIDRVCDDLRSYKRNMSKLPFNIGGANVERVALTEGTTTQKFTNPDDVVDKELFNLLSN